MLGRLKQAASNIKNKLQPDELDQQLAQAVSDQNWQASTQLLHDIASQAYQPEKQQRILVFISDKMKHSNWKKVIKILHMVDFLLKNGPYTTVNSLKQNVYEFRCLDSYSHFESGQDQGEAIRKQAKAIVDLISDESRLADERAQAKQIKDRMSSVLGTSSKYGSFSSSGDWKAQREGSQIYHSTQFQSSTNKNKQLSFGESVMRSLQKKQPKPTEPTPEPMPVKPSTMMKGPSNTSTGVVGEPKREEKKNFGSLHMKLVKPPEKKPTTQKPKEVLKGMNIKPQPKGPQKVEKPPTGDIMNIDFGIIPQTDHSEVRTQDPFDLLGAGSVSPASTPAVPQATKNTSSNDLMFESKIATQSPLDAAPQVNPPTMNMNWNLGAQFQTAQPQTVKSQPASNLTQITLETAKPSQSQPLNQENKANSLIDFSNFREQLDNLPKEKSSDITSGWNW